MFFHDRDTSTLSRIGLFSDTEVQKQPLHLIKNDISQLYTDTSILQPLQTDPLSKASLKTVQG
jgi:hypothetical protein